MKKALVFLSALFWYAQMQAQTVGVSQLASKDSLTACAIKNQSFAVSPSRILQSVDTIFVWLKPTANFKLSDTLFFDNSTLLYSKKAQVGEKKYFAIYNFNNTQNINFRYHLSAPCAAFSDQNVLGKDSLGVKLNRTGATNYLVSRSYTLFSPLLVFDINQNKELVKSANILEQFTRRIVFRNTSPVGFDGAFVFKDSLFYRLKQIMRGEVVPNASVNFKGIRIAYPENVTISQTLLSDSSVYIRAFTNSAIGKNDSIVVEETLLLLDCGGDAQEKSRTRFSFNYGCKNDLPLCASVQANGMQTTTEATNIGPLVKFISQKVVNQTNCLDAEAVVSEIMFSNSGNGISSNVRFRYNFCDGSFKTTTDPSEIKVYKIKNGVRLLQNLSDYTLVCSVTDPDLNRNINSYDIRVNTAVYPNDTFVLQSKIRKVHSGNRDKAFYANQVNILLNHPCRPHSLDVNFVRNPFVNGFSQYIETNINMIAGRDFSKPSSPSGTAWFEITGNNRLRPFELYGNDQFLAFDVRKMQIKVALGFKKALSMIQDSIYLKSVINGTEYRYKPDKIDYHFGPEGQGTGDSIIAYFNMAQFVKHPEWIAYLEDNIWRPGNLTSNGIFSNLPGNDFFKQTLNSINIRFKVQAYCGGKYYVPGGKSGFNETFYMIRDVDCVNEEPYQFCGVGKKLQINCPGCFVPGWNVYNLDTKRINFGYVDNDDNQYPDNIPPVKSDGSNINPYRATWGDTLQSSFFAATSDGEALNFGNAGFDFKYMIYKMSSGLNSFLKPLGGRGVIKGSSGTAHPFFVPASAFQLVNSTFYVDLSIAALKSYGVDTNDFNKADAASTMTFDPQFVIKDNPVSAGEGDDPYFGTQEFAAFVYMSGTPFAIPENKSDALSYDNTRLYTELTFEQRKNLLYWCTSGGGLVTNVGVLFNKDDNASSNYRFTDSLSGYAYDGNNYCYLFTGNIMRHVLGFRGGSFDDHSQRGKNAFGKEVRNFMLVDSVVQKSPEAFEFQNADVATYAIQVDSLRNLYDYYRLSDVQNTYKMVEKRPGNVIAYYPSRTYIYRTKPKDFPSVYFVNLQTQTYPGDESNVKALYSFFKLKNYKTTPDTIHLINSLTSRIYISNMAKYPNRDTVLVSRYNYIYRKPKGVLNASPEFPVVDAVTKSFDWKLNLSVNPDIRINEHNFAYNVFVQFVSPSGNVKVNNVSLGGNPLASVGNVGGLPLYGLSEKMSSWDPILQPVINSSYTCTALEKRDSLLIIYGWNCYGYPTDLKDACFLDTTKVYFNPKPAGLLGGISSFDKVVQACDIIKGSIKLDAIGLGNIGNVQVALASQGVGYLDIAPGTSFITYGSNRIALEPNRTTTKPTYQLDAIPDIRDNFNSSAFDRTGSVLIEFGLQTGCSYGKDAVQFDVSYEKYCGAKRSFSILEKPNVIVGLPVLDSLSATYTATPVFACGDSSVITLTIRNLGKKSTNGLNYFTISPIDNLLFKLANGTYQSSLTQTLPAGIVPGGSYSVSFKAKTLTKACDSLAFNIQVVAVDNNECKGVRCFVKSTQTDKIAKIGVVKPAIVIQALNTDGICSNGATAVSATLQNATSYSNTIVVNYFCADSVNNQLVQKCKIGSATVTLASFTTKEVSTIPTLNCQSCKGMIVTISPKESCVCDSIVAKTAVNCCKISVNATPKTASVCVGQCTTLTATVTGGTTNTTIAWYKKGSTNVLGTNATLSVCPTIATKYKVVVSQGSNCVKSDSVQVNIQAASFLTASAPTQICSGENAVLSASGGVSYTWSTSAGTVISRLSTVTVKPTVTSTYTVRSVSSSGCTDTKSVTVTVISQPLITTSPTDTLVCAGSSVRLKTNVVCAKTSPFASVCNAPQTSTVTCAACNSFASGSANVDVNSGRTVCVAAGATFTGSINMNGGQFVICGSATPSNINYNSGNIVVNGTATFNNLNMNDPTSVFKNYGTLVFGNVTFNGRVENHGTMTVQNDFNVNSGASFSNTNRLIAQRSINNNETFVNAGWITATVDVKNNRGTMTNQCRIEAGNEFHNNALMTHNGYVSSGKATYLNASGTTTFGIGASIHARDIYMNGKVIGPTTGCAQLKVSNNSTVNSSSVAQGKIELCDANGVEINSGIWTSGASVGCGCTGLLSGRGNNGIVYSWSPATGLNNTISATPIATITQPITYTLSVTDFAGVQSTSSIKFGIKTTGCVSARMEESELGSSSSSPETTSGAYIYPNPSEHEFTLAISPKSFNTSIQVFDGKGILVEEKNMEEGESNYYFGKNYKSGMYTVKIASGNSVNYYKLVKIQ